MLLFSFILFIATCPAPLDVENGSVKYRLHSNKYHSIETAVDGQVPASSIETPIDGQVPEKTYAYVTCNRMYTRSGQWENRCLNGAWKHPFTTCVGNDNFYN